MARVLCVEDDPELRGMISDALIDAGFDVVGAANGKQALEKLEAFLPDVVVSDLAMPVMNGFELMQALRENFPDCVDVPFIILTGQTATNAVISGLSAGADDYLTKPLDMEVLVAKVHAVLRQISRMKARKEHDMVRLYRALRESGQDISNLASGADLDDHADVALNAQRAPISVSLVGRDEPSLDSLRQQLEALGAEVTRCPSGKGFLDSIAEVSSDVALISYFTTDMQGNLVARFAKDSGERPDLTMILVWPEESGKIPHLVRNEVAIDDLWELPVADLESRMARWLDDAEVAPSEIEEMAHG